MKTHPLLQGEDIHPPYLHNILLTEPLVFLLLCRHSQDAPQTLPALQKNTGTRKGRHPYHLLQVYIISMACQLSLFPESQKQVTNMLELNASSADNLSSFEASLTDEAASVFVFHLTVGRCFNKL